MLSLWRETSREITLSVFHLEVSALLTACGIKHVNEYLAEWGLFSVDIAIIEELPGGERKKIAVEVDGPQHFAVNTNQPLGHTVLRRRLLKALGWDVVSVPHFEWWAFGPGTEGTRSKIEYLERFVGSRLYSRTPRGGPVLSVAADAEKNKDKESQDAAAAAAVARQTSEELTVQLSGAAEREAREGPRKPGAEDLFRSGAMIAPFRPIGSSTGAPPTTRRAVATQLSEAQLRSYRYSLGLASKVVMDMGVASAEPVIGSSDSESDEPDDAMIITGPTTRPTLRDSEPPAPAPRSRPALTAKAYQAAAVVSRRVSRRKASDPIPGPGAAAAAAPPSASPPPSPVLSRLAELKGGREGLLKKAARPWEVAGQSQPQGGAAEGAEGAGVNSEPAAPVPVRKRGSARRRGWDSDSEGESESEEAGAN